MSLKYGKNGLPVSSPQCVRPHAAEQRRADEPSGAEYHERCQRMRKGAVNTSTPAASPIANGAIVSFRPTAMPQMSPAAPKRHNCRTPTVSANHQQQRHQHEQTSSSCRCWSCRPESAPCRRSYLATARTSAEPVVTRRRSSADCGTRAADTQAETQTVNATDGEADAPRRQILRGHVTRHIRQRIVVSGVMRHRHVDSRCDRSATRTRCTSGSCGSPSPASRPCSSEINPNAGTSTQANADGRLRNGAIEGRGTSAAIDPVRDGLRLRGVNDTVQRP